MLIALFLAMLPYALLTAASPIVGATALTRSLGLQPRCGPVQQFYNPKNVDWNLNGLNEWLDSWWTNHTSDIQSNSNGFAGAFGEWALGDPDWTCRDEGSSSNCDINACDARVLNDKGDFIRQTYYVLEAVQNLHEYFIGLGQAFEVSAINAALSKDSWATTFYKDKDDKTVGPLKELLNGLQTIVGLGACAAILGGELSATAGAVVSTLFNGAVGEANAQIGQHKDDTFEKSADLGAILGRIVVDSMKGFTSANNDLMQGKSFADTGDIRNYLRDGAFVGFGGVDKNAVTDSLSNMLIANAINELYRTQKIFVMGGGRCGDGEGIGSGPQEAVYCRDGKSWYLYYWQENDAAISLTSHRWGWVNATPGMDQLGQPGPYAGITIQDVIASSLDSYNVAGYSYTPDTASERAQSALRDGWRNPAAQGPSWEGTFTIPVCDVSSTIADPNFESKEWILQPYGHEMRPTWCGAICGGDLQKTRDFIHTANMDGFDSPKHLCDNKY